MATGDVIGRLSIDDDPSLEAYHLSYSPDGKYLACGVRGTPQQVGSALVLVDTVSRSRVAQESEGFEFEPVPSFSPDGNRLAVVADDSLEMWSVDPLKKLFSTPDVDFDYATFSTDGSLVYGAKKIPSGVHVIDSETGQVRDVILEDLAGAEELRLMTMRVDSERLTLAYCPDRVLRIDLQSHEVIEDFTLPTQCADGCPMALSPDNTKLVGLPRDRISAWALPQ